MRKTPLVLLSTSLIIVALLSIEMRTPVVTAKADASVSLSPTPQNAHFIWVSAEGDQSVPGYKRVVGGKHDDGNTMYICRVSGMTPGKVYRNSCHYSAAGQEYVIQLNYEILLSDTGYEWRSLNAISRADIKKSAVLAGTDPNTKDPLYMCRKHMSDGTHPGKYSYKNNLCYIPWGNQERFYVKNFEVLFPSQ